MKTAAVVGADSMLGRMITCQLREQGVKVIRVGRASHHDIVIDLAYPVSCDLGIAQKADVVFHCAGVFEDDSHDGIYNNFLVNTVGCAGILALMEQLECNACVYAGSVSSITGADSDSFSSYGFSKAQGEQILAWGMERIGGKFCSLRFSQLYDTEGRCCSHQPWFGRIIAYASRGMDLRLPPSSGVRNFLHVIDAARLMILAAECALTGCWPVCHKEELDNTQIAELAYREFDNGGQLIIDMNKKPFRPFNFPNDCTLFDQTGYIPCIGMTEGIAMIHSSGQYVNFGPIDVQ